MVSEDTTALLQGVSLQEVVPERMENGSVNTHAVFPLHAETGTQKFFFTSCYTWKSRCTCLRTVQEFALQERICTATFSAQGVSKFLMTVWCLSFTDFGISISCKFPHVMAADENCHRNCSDTDKVSGQTFANRQPRGLLVAFPPIYILHTNCIQGKLSP